MSDIVELLRREASKQDMLTCEYMLQAADKIEQLHEDLHYNRGVLDLAMKHRDEAEAEIERLRRKNSYLVHTDEDIKVQNAEIERLRADNAELQNEIERLRAER